MKKEKMIHFGERVEGFDVRMLNEREVRASAGILFFFAIVSFMNAWFNGSFYMTKVFVLAFLVDFFIRIFINPRYAPSLVIGRFVVRNQKPEYVGAPQKRFAWSIGFALASIMFFLVIIGDVVGPLNLFVCLSCLILLFFETAFGICIGCKFYNIFHKKQAQLCPGGTCNTHKREKIQTITMTQGGVVALFVLFIVTAGFFVSYRDIAQQDVRTQMETFKQEINVVEMPVADDDAITHEAQGDSVDDNCVVPDWAIKLGHEEKWKLHNECT